MQDSGRCLDVEAWDSPGIDHVGPGIRGLCRTLRSSCNCSVVLLLLALSASLFTSVADAVKTSKRGIAYVGDTASADNQLLTASNSPLSWFYNWAVYPPPQIPPQGLEFVPLIHGLDDAASSAIRNQVDSLPSSSTHLLTFNEPDGTTSSGGSSISPDDAAKSYHQDILPYRSTGRKWQISHPSTTGSSSGLDWLRRFNASCFAIDKVDGCPTDFIAVHWYGGFPGLASWLGTLDEFYNKNTSRSTPLKMFVTELALPQQDAGANLQMMNETLPYLDGLDYVERYAWFGAFRSGAANEWTGSGVSLFDAQGGLTDIGALYLGGLANGFRPGQKGQGQTSSASARPTATAGFSSAPATSLPKMLHWRGLIVSAVVAVLVC